MYPNFGKVEQLLERECTSLSSERFHGGLIPPSENSVSLLYKEGSVFHVETLPLFQVEYNWISFLRSVCGMYICE